MTKTSPKLVALFVLVVSAAALLAATAAPALAAGSPPTIESETTDPNTVTVSAFGLLLKLNGSGNGEEITGCSFQYGSESEGKLSEHVEHEAQCTGGTILHSVDGEGSVFVTVQAGTTYRFRGVLKNASGETTFGKEERFKTAIAPETPVGESANPVGTTGVTLHGVLNADKPGEAGTYKFLYRQSASECKITKEEAEKGIKQKQAPEPVGNDYGEEEEAASYGEQAERVSAGVTGLSPGATYTFCLRAVNAVAEEAVGAPVTFTTPLRGVPLVSEESVADVRSSSATLYATLNPEGAQTSYAFEYAPEGGEFTAVPEAEGHGQLPAGSTPVPLSVHVQQGLLPSTTYRFRLVAKNEVSKAQHKPVEGERGESGEEVAHAFTTQGPGREFALPDNRTWEMVTPPDKHDALFYGLNDAFLGIAPNPFVAQASAAGDAIVELASSPPESQPQGFANEAMVLSTRTSLGWSSQDISPPHAPSKGAGLNNAGGGSEYDFFSEDLALGVLNQPGSFLALSPQATEQSPYLRSVYLNGNVAEHCEGSYLSASSCFTPLVTHPGDDTAKPFEPFGEEPNGKCESIEGFERFICGPEFSDATPDGSHIVLLSPFAGGYQAQLTATPDEGSSRGRLYEWSAGQLQPLYLLPESQACKENKVSKQCEESKENGVGVGEQDEISRVFHQLSDDGSVFFDHAGHLYVHDFARDESARLDVAQGVAEPEEGDAEFLYASSDGSRVLFSDPQQLTESPGGGIYECRLAASGPPACEALILTGLSGGSLIDGSEDASYLYFLSAAGKLIVDHGEGVGWTTTRGPFIGQLAISSEPAYRVSPNGQWFTFMSSEDLTGYDTADANSGKPDGEVYLYDAAANRLVCASCDPTGARPVGTEYGISELTSGEFAESGEWVASSLPPWTLSHSSDGYAEATYQPRYLSNSGRLFFNSYDALVPADTNGTADVYEYEPEGVGPEDDRCAASTSSPGDVFSRAAHGCVALISAGTSPQESAFLDASENGSDVFFLTTSKLAPQDIDSAYDVYDAHECTPESPCPAPAAVQPPPCETEASCKPPPTPQPGIYGPPSSATFSGPGNVSPPPAVVPKTVTKKAAKCKRGFTKKKNRCVKNKKKKNQARKSAHTTRRPNR